MDLRNILTILLVYSLTRQGSAPAKPILLIIRNDACCTNRIILDAKYPHGGNFSINL